MKYTKKQERQINEVLKEARTQIARILNKSVNNVLLDLYHGEVNPANYLSMVESVLGLPDGTIKANNSRKESVINALTIAVRLISDNFSISTLKIGKYLNRDHSTVLHHRDKFGDWVQLPKQYIDRLAEYQKVLEVMQRSGIKVKSYPMFDKIKEKHLNL